MSKNHRNGVAGQSRCRSSDEVSDSDDEICLIDEICPNSSREYCHPVIDLSDSGNEFTMKRKQDEYNNDTDSESESNKYLRMKKFRPDFYKRGNRQTEKPEDLFVIDKNSQALVEDEFHQCEVCRATFHTHDLYQKHMNSSSHEKAVKRMEERMRSAARKRHPVVNGHEAIRQSDKYPSVPFGVKRQKIRDVSFIQQVVEERIRVCPGLEHVTEIRGQRETSYFCGICDKLLDEAKNLFIHLKTNNHKVKSLKALNPIWYRELQDMHISERKRTLRGMLSEIQNSEGIGKIVVEKDYLDADNYNTSHYLDSPGTSSDSANVIYCPNTESSIVLSDSSKNHYFCRICECNMFNTELWESHFKRRFKSLRKYSVGEAPKIKIEKLEVEAFLIARVNIPNSDPMVGLEYVREFQHEDAKKETYHCILCGDCLSCIDITQHLASLYHRKKYIEHINHHSVDYVNSLDPNDNRTFYKVEEICKTIENDSGRGFPKVYSIKKSET